MGSPGFADIAEKINLITKPIKRHLDIEADDNFKFCRFFKNNLSGMIFHENRLFADDSHEISYLIFLRNYERKFVVSCSCDWRFKG